MIFNMKNTLNEESNELEIPVQDDWENDEELRPPLAVVGSQTNREEVMFGKVFDGRVVRRFAKYVKPYKRRLILALVSVLIFTGTQLAIPLVIRVTIDNTLVGSAAGRQTLTVAVLFFAGIILLNYGANYVQELTSSIIGEKILFDLRRSMFKHLQRVSLSFMDKTETGRLMSRLQGDVHALQQFLENSIFAVGDIVLLLGIVVVLISLNLQLGLLTLAIVPVLFLVRILWLPKARQAFIHARHTSSSVNGALAEGINGVRTIQAMGREDVNFTLFKDKAYDNLQSHLRATRFAQIMIPIVTTLTGIAMAVVVIVGGNMVLEGNLQLGIMVAYVFYVQRFFAPIRSITMQYSIMQRAMASGHRIFEVLDVPLDVKDKKDAAALKNIEGKIEFKDVTFGYEKDNPILEHISFTVNPGETVALVGPTGSGKTSLTALAHRFYDIWDGSIKIDGLDIRDVSQESLGKNIAMVLQEPFLFSGTIYENIRYNTGDIGFEQIRAAAEAVGAHGFISELPNGYNTKVEQGGGNLSQGQQQLISFARALAADTKILVLDEATANIDSYTEKLIQKALTRLLQNRTGLVIAHRLSTIRGSDRIVVLQNGRIVETGTHDELIAKNELYAKLYSMNYSSFDDIPDDIIAGLGDYDAHT